MGAPPRDSEGRVVPHDDADIPGDAYVLRYIVSAWLKPHQSVPGLRRLSSAAFSPSSKRHDLYQGMSVDLLQPMLDAGLSPTDRMGDKYEAIVQLRVRDLRSIGLQVGSDPLLGNPFHAAVWGVKEGTRKRLIKLYEWLDKPDDVVAELVPLTQT
jgi:hypothetical protein